MQRGGRFGSLWSRHGLRTAAVLLGLFLLGLYLGRQPAPGQQEAQAMAVKAWSMAAERMQQLLLRSDATPIAVVEEHHHALVSLDLSPSTICLSFNHLSLSRTLSLYLSVSVCVCVAALAAMGPQRPPPQRHPRAL